MAKWEYLVVFMEGSTLAQDKPEIDVYLDVDKYTDSLNKYGDAGWELVNFETYGNGARAAFKRMKVGQAEKPKRKSKAKKTPEAILEE